MANNLRVFNTNSEYQSADLVHPAVSYVIETDKVHYEPTTPSFQGKWKATYSNGNVTSAECDSSSAITKNEINLINLVSVEIGDCVTRIGSSAFDSCSSLTSCTIGSGVTNIGGTAFYNCSSLTSITVNATTPPTLSFACFFNSNDCPIYVPCESVEAYKTASRWSDYASRITCIQPSFKWKAILSNGTTQSGACTSSTVLNGYSLPTNTVNLEVGDCVTEISGFEGYVNGLRSCTISDSVTKIGGSVFYQKYDLKTVEVGSGVTTIGKWAFNSCNRLESLTFKSIVPPTLGDYVFVNTNNCPIYVPAQSVNAYKSASGWRDVQSRIQTIQE